METESATIDNDVLLKLACFGLLDKLLEALRVDADNAYILGAAKFVIRRAIDRRFSENNKQRASAQFESFISAVNQVEPTEDEIGFATEIEDAAIRNGVEVDVGESLLTSITIKRSIELLATGDKRAIVGLEKLIALMPSLEEIKGRVACFEQIMQALASLVGIDEIRDRVCSEPETDIALTMCCSCSNPSAAATSLLDGLTSYIKNIRDNAPNILASIT